MNIFNLFFLLKIFSLFQEILFLYINFHLFYFYFTLHQLWKNFNRSFISLSQSLMHVPAISRLVWLEHCERKNSVRSEI